MEILTRVVNVKGEDTIVPCHVDYDICTIPSVDINGIDISKITKFNVGYLHIQNIGLTMLHGPTIIDDDAFAYCDGLTGSLSIPDTITSIGERAFSGCSGFTGSLTIPNSVTIISDNAFYNCSGFTGNLVIPDGVTKIGNIAFATCSSFTGLVIPKSVEFIGSSAFSGCSGLSCSLTLPDSLIFIGSAAFAGCSNFVGSLTIPKSVTYIGSSAFSDCSGLLGSLILPDSLIFIGSSAFVGCSNLIGTLAIPKKVNTIHDRAFEGCLRLLKIVIPNSVKVIGNRAFEGCYGLRGTLIIPDSVTTIGNRAFEGCFGLCGTLVIPDSVTKIGDYAFAGSDLIVKLSSSTIPIDVGVGAFPKMAKTNKFIQTELEIESMPLSLRKEINMYTKSVEINRFLRDTKRDFKPTKSKRPGVKQRMLRRLDLAFSLVSPLSRDITVYRGVTGSFYPDDLGYTSTSETHLTSEQVKLFTEDNCSILEIRVPAGSRVLRIPASVGYYGDENEVLLFRGGKFKEVGRRISDTGMHIFSLDYAEGPLPEQHPQLLSEMRNFMNTNLSFFELLKDENNTSKIQKFEELVKKNPSLMFRCLMSDMAFEKPKDLIWKKYLYIVLEEYLEIILTNYPSVTKTIEGLDALFDLHNATSVRDKIQKS